MVKPYYLEYSNMGEHGSDYFFKVRDLKKWAKERCDSEVLNRPVENIHRETLRMTWQQIIDLCSLSESP